jgi:hypothetical protein
MVGGMLSPVSIRRTSFAASSRAWPGAHVGIQHYRELTVRALQRRRPEPALDSGDVVDPDRSVRRRHRQPADLLDVAALILAHPDLHRVLFGPFLVERDLVVAGHGQPQRVADRRHPHAEIRGALAVDGDVNLRVREVQRDLASVRLGSFCAAERALRVLGDLLEIGPRMFAAMAKPPCLRRCPARCAR